MFARRFLGVRHREETIPRCASAPSRRGLRAGRPDADAPAAQRGDPPAVPQGAGAEPRVPRPVRAELPDAPSAGGFPETRARDFAHEDRAAHQGGQAERAAHGEGVARARRLRARHAACVRSSGSRETPPRRRGRGARRAPPSGAAKPKPPAQVFSSAARGRGQGDVHARASAAQDRAVEPARVG